MALQVPYLDLVFKDDAGLVTSEVLKNAGSITGVRVTRGPDFTTTTGPEYCTIRSFSFTAEAEYPINANGLLLLNFTESLAFSGGLPLYVHRLAINGPPQKQLVYPQTVYRVTQSGEAVGYTTTPLANPPKWPFALKEAPDIGTRSPERKGQGYQGYSISWTYRFESATPLLGAPSLWVN